jgi:DNA-nicking Smr family endonuclease
MTKKGEEPFNNPFAKLKVPAKEAPKSAAAPARVAAPVRAPPPSKKRTADDDDAAMFLEAVGGVAPVKVKPQRVDPTAPPAPVIDRVLEEAESLTRLAELITPEDVFELDEDGERVEGHVRGFDERVVKRLRAGQFKVDASVDLHGLKKDEAQKAVEQLVQRARVAGHRCVVIVTGRGLHSESAAPVLKPEVPLWLSRGRTSKQVLAFCSAPPQHGGVGAIIVLLRR